MVSMSRRTLLGFSRQIRRTTALLLAALLSLFAAGCRLGPEPDYTIYLTWWVTYAPESAEYAAFESIADAYTRRTEDIVIDVVGVPWDSIAPRGIGMSRLELAQQAGEGPDLWGPIPHNWTGGLATAGQAGALNLTEIADVQQYVDIAVQACRYNDQLYGLPVLMDSMALIYNKALIPKPPQTFEELLDLAQGLRDEEKEIWALALPLLSQYHTYPFIDGYGGYIFGCSGEGCDLTDIGLNNEGAVHGIQYLSDLYVTEGLFPEPLSDRDYMHETARQLFIEGKAATLIDGSWILPHIRASQIDYGIAPIPALPDTDASPRALTTVLAMYVGPELAYPREVIDLLNFVAGEESVTTMQQVLGKTPVRQDILRSNRFRPDPEIREWRRLAAGGVLLPNTPELGYVWAPWARALDEAIPGLTPTQDALDRAVEQIRTDLGQDRVPENPLANEVP
jgi:arabinogalactan oligomer/maltooligosaccharide transport system substrate-binding protein